MPDKIEELADQIYQIIGKGSSGKISDLIVAFSEMKNLLRAELSTHYNKGYHDGIDFQQKLQIKKQQKEN